MEKIITYNKTNNNDVINAIKNMDPIVVDNTSIKSVVTKAIEIHGKNVNLNFIDVSNVTNMDSMFADSEFNGDISKWDVSHVTNMNYMFAFSKFTGDISKWNVSNVTSMGNMFTESEFNGNISKWNTFNVVNMSCMFSDSEFTGDISNWDVSNVIDMYRIFASSKFKGDISKWNFTWKYIVPQNLKIGYKKVKINDNYHSCIAVLELPSDAIKIHPINEQSRKCRTNKCKVIGFKDIHGNNIEVNEAFSTYDTTFKYHLNDEIEIIYFDPCIWNECSTGIHFFEDINDVISY